MIRQLGTPTWFYTVSSSADLKWPDMIQVIARQYGHNYTDEEVDAMSFDEKSAWLRRKTLPIQIVNDFLKSKAHPLGEITDYTIRIEFQQRHAHSVLWVKDAPKYGVNDDSEVCQFIDKYITCSIPRGWYFKRFSAVSATAQAFHILQKENGFV